MLYGAIFGVICVPIFHLLMLSSYPAKRYMKQLKAEIEDVLSVEEQEEFAGQMLSDESEVKVISWRAGGKLEGIREGKVRLSKDYALLTTTAGGAVMVQLSRVQEIDVDVIEYTFTSRGGGIKIQQTSTVYPMYFYYRTYAQGEKKKCDKEFAFEIRETREEVSHYLNEMKVGKQE